VLTSRRLFALALIALSALAWWLYQRRVAEVPPSIPFPVWVYPMPDQEREWTITW